MASLVGCKGKDAVLTYNGKSDQGNYFLIFSHLCLLLILMGLRAEIAVRSLFLRPTSYVRAFLVILLHSIATIIFGKKYGIVEQRSII